jgi:hypothetical protein
MALESSLQPSTTALCPQPNEQNHTSPPIFFRQVSMLSSQLRAGIQSGIFLSGLTNKISNKVLIPMRAICPSHLTFPNLLTLTIFR